MRGERPVLCPSCRVSERQAGGAAGVYIQQFFIRHRAVCWEGCALKRCKTTAPDGGAMYIADARLSVVAMAELVVRENSLLKRPHRRPRGTPLCRRGTRGTGPEPVYAIVPEARFFELACHRETEHVALARVGGGPSRSPCRKGTVTGEFFAAGADAAAHPTAPAMPPCSNSRTSEGFGLVSSRRTQDWRLGRGIGDFAGFRSPFGSKVRLISRRLRRAQAKHRSMKGLRPGIAVFAGKGPANSRTRSATSFAMLRISDAVAVFMLTTGRRAGSRRTRAVDAGGGPGVG